MAAMALALAGCASTVELPGNPTGDELDRLLALELDFQWQYVGLPPDDPRPEVELVRFVSSEEAAEVHRACMVEAGYENFNVIVGAIYGGASIDERVAIYSCTAKYPTLPSTYGLFSEAQLDYLYDHYIHVTVPCIESTGISVGEVPSREDFVKPPSYLFDTWVPYRQLEAENGYLSTVKCRYLPEGFPPF